MSPSFDYAEAIRDGMRGAHWETEDLWVATVALSGRLDPGDIDGITSGRRAASWFEYNILAAALNEHFSDRGQNHPIPYWNDARLDPR